MNSTQIREAMIAAFRQHRKAEHECEDDTAYFNCPTCEKWDRRLVRLREQSDGARR